MTNLTRLSMLAAYGLLAACSAVEPSQGDPVVMVDSPYILGPGDRVKVLVYRHDDLSGDFAIDGQGYLALPLGQEIKAGGLTSRQLEEAIEARFRDDQYLIHPAVAVEIVDHRPVFVLGEVRDPGAYAHVAGMSVTHAVAIAGGATYRADMGDVTITRAGAELPATAATALLPGDVVTIGERWF